MAPSRPIVRTLAVRALVVVGLVLVVGCSDDGETTTAGSGLEMPTETTGVADSTEGDGTEATTTESEPEDVESTPANAGAVDPAVAEPACAGFAGFFPMPVQGEEPMDDTGLLDALEGLAADGPEPLRTQAQAVLDLEAIDSGEAELSEEEMVVAYQEGLVAVRGIYAWALDTCEVDDVVWACVELNGAERFETVGEAIAGDDGTEIVTTTTEPGAARPEDVYAEAEMDGDPVEVSRTDDHVLVAWLDADGHAVATLDVIDDGGWRHDGRTTCDDGEDSEDDEGFAPVGGPIEPGG